MRDGLNSSCVWIAGVCVTGVLMLMGCGKRVDALPPLYVLPEVNEANCESAAIKAMPENEARQRFADQCSWRSKPVHSEPKSYTF